ncbi:MAG: nucleoside-diphosphate kinase [Planctomycetes bacterium]|nr:nucleoside-diphosphate kinase [Planctomycetota bacterium]
MERTLVLLKPDAVQRGLVGAITHRFERKGLKIVALKLMQITRKLAQRHYAPHKGKDFYEPLLEFVTAGPTVAIVLEGNDAVRVARTMMGDTFGPEAIPGTIRGDYGMSKRYNLIHGSDSPATAAKEIELFFSPNEVCHYDRPRDAWTYARAGGELI